MSALMVTLGTLDFNTDVLVDDVVWSMDLTAGWWDGPEVDMDLLPTIDEGSAVGRVMMRHRTVIGAGIAAPRSVAAHDAAHLVIEQLVSPYVEVPLIVHERTGARHLMVRGAPPQVRCHGRAIEFQLTLTSLSPHKLPHPAP